MSNPTFLTHSFSAVFVKYVKSHFINQCIDLIRINSTQRNGLVNLLNLKIHFWTCASSVMFKTRHFIFIPLFIFHQMQTVGWTRLFIKPLPFVTVAMSFKPLSFALTSHAQPLQRGVLGQVVNSLSWLKPLLHLNMSL